MQDRTEKLKQETITIKQLEEMYDKFQKKLWREHEDVRGDDMIEVGYAEQFLQDLLMEFGCWEEADEGQLNKQKEGGFWGPPSFVSYSLIIFSNILAIRR